MFLKQLLDSPMLITCSSKVDLLLTESKRFPIQVFKSAYLIFHCLSSSLNSQFWCFKSYIIFSKFFWILAASSVLSDLSAFLLSTYFYFSVLRRDSCSSLVFSAPSAATLISPPKTPTLFQYSKIVPLSSAIQIDFFSISLFNRVSNSLVASICLLYLSQFS